MEDDKTKILTALIFCLCLIVIVSVLLFIFNNSLEKEVKKSYIECSKYGITTEECGITKNVDCAKSCQELGYVQFRIIRDHTTHCFCRKNDMVMQVW